MDKRELNTIISTAIKNGENYVDLSNNNISALPPEIGNAKRIISLVLKNNKLTALPSEIGKLENLAVLDISDNPIKAIPQEIFDLPIRRLDVNNCQLTSIPIEIRKSRLQVLDLRNNRLPIPIEILERIDDPYTILEYYFRHIAQERRPLNEAKMILVGQGSVGKTSLARMLIAGIFDPRESKTDGISIQKWNVTVPNLDKKVKGKHRSIRVNIWDFGGQEIMHATHQFFLTKRSLYLLVVDARSTQEENRIEYWLKIIQSFGGESPIILIGNKADQHPLDIDTQGLKRKYSNLKAVIETSCSAGIGIEELKSVITKELRSLPHVEDLLPVSWFSVKSHLELMKEEYIKYSDYLQICIKNDTRDEQSQETLMDFLHDLGIVLNFKNDPHLQETNVLNPEWVTNGVYRILNSHSLFQSKGILLYKDLEHILDENRYPRKERTFIIDMMKKFELCFSFDDERIGVLVPDLLPKDEIYTGTWASALGFQYQYDVLPSSIITRFIVRMHLYIDKNTVWRSGVVLTDKENHALVKADYEEKRIYIWIDGPEETRRDFLSAIRFQLDAVHRTLAKITPKEKIPIPGSMVTVDYEHLLKLDHRGVKRFPPEGLDDSINIKQLLDRVTTKTERDDFARRKYSGRFSIKQIILDTIGLLVAVVLFALKGLLSFPKNIGRFIFDILGRGDKSAELSHTLMGYAVVIVFVLLILGILDNDLLMNLWRFFFPEPK
jgi:internalin A